MASAQTVIFDLDGTLLDGDSTTAWMLSRIRKSWWRTTLACVSAPFALILMLVSRRLGASLALWVASVGLSREALQDSFRLAAHDDPFWRPKALEAFRRHIARGDRVVVATAAPRWLAEALLEPLAPRTPVVGSELAPLLGGWIGARHCRHQAKCEALVEAGHGPAWAVAYSDSVDDWPLLARAGRAFVVNGSPNALARLEKLGVTAHHIAW